MQYDEFKTVEDERIPSGALATRWKFPNGYGASLIKGGMAYGGLELAVLFYEEDGSWSLCYDTPITDDVIGYLDMDEVSSLLERIKSL